ncbi:glyoxalase [Fibrella sp. HMF5335]|uniref:Glyoxalase n=1 Tax=Fibrella rubiginis TaxID=2817060 RepID=A0A939K035_9BACT|nr:glyoxalase [Fibrella rubiginis]
MEQSPEAFQNGTLRSILKLHNDLFTSLFRNYLVKRKQGGPDGRFARITQPEQVAYIDHTIRTDQKFKNLLVGTVVGQFTTAELSAFLADEAELTRRIVGMIIDRLSSQLTLLIRADQAAE